MTYLINNEITFRPDDGVMANLASPESAVVLSTTANRIFTYLLEQNGKIVSRDDIFVNVWDKNGLQASNNSLSQYISLIRRSLHDLGCIQEVIQTIPRIGFLIPEGLIACSEPAPSLRSPDSPPRQAQKSPPLPGAIKFIVAGSLALSLGLMFISLAPLNGDKASPATSVATWKLGDIDSCPVYTFYRSSPERVQGKLEQAHKLANQYLGCIKGATFYYQPDDLYVYGESGRVFLSRCTWSDKERNTFAGCKDIYIHEF